MIQGNAAVQNKEMVNSEYCDAAWSIARRFEPSNAQQMKALAAAIHGAVLNENRRCRKTIVDTRRLATGMKSPSNPTEDGNPVEEMCVSLEQALATSFGYT